MLEHILGKPYIQLVSSLFYLVGSSLSRHSPIGALQYQLRQALYLQVLADLVHASQYFRVCEASAGSSSKIPGQFSKVEIFDRHAERLRR